MDQIAPRFPGSNAGRSRAYNRGLVLRLVRSEGGAGRAAIARTSGLTTQAVSNIIADLVDEGLVEEVGRRTGARGQPAVQYGVKACGGYALGVEVRPDALLAALVDLSGRAVWSDRRALPHADPEAVLTEVAALRATALRGAGIAPDRLRGVGLVVPGPFGATGLSDPATELPGWSGIAVQDWAVQDWFQDRLGLPVLVENDANAAAVAERVCGVARGLSTYAFLYFGTGIGLGLVANDTLLRGAFGNAGEIGHIQVAGPFRGRSLQSVASRLALAGRLGAAGMPGQTVEDIAAALTADHRAVTFWLQEAGAALAQAVQVVENLFDPQTVILGGALPDALLDRLIAHIPLSRASVAARADRRHPRLMRGAAGRMTAALGAGALVVDRIFTPTLDPPA